MPESKSKVKSQKSKVPVSRQSGQVKNKKLETKDSSLTVDVFDIKGKVAGSVTLPKEIFGAKINPVLMAQAVRVYLANQRRGTSSTKTRGEVQGSTRKIYRQKGTGRARHGSNRAPIFVHGGVAFGPKPRDFSLSLPKKMRKAALFSALSSKVQDGAVMVVSGMEKIEPKTKLFAQIMDKLSLVDKKKKILLILPTKLVMVDRAARNITGVQVAQAQNLHAYTVLNAKKLLMLEASVQVMKEQYIKS